MASNLSKNLGPSKFWVFDHLHEKSLLFKKEHKDVYIAPTPLELAKNCSIIVTMLPASAHVRSVYLGINGLKDGIKPNTLVIDSSTIDPSTTKEIASILKERHVSMLDAPVSGGTLGAQAGTLTFMVGAESQEIFEKSSSILKHMGKNITFCGGNGNGQVAKICNNVSIFFHVDVTRNIHDCCFGNHESRCKDGNGPQIISWNY